MGRRKTEIHKIIDEHLGLHGSPSLKEMDDSRERTLQRLLSKAAVTNSSATSEPPRLLAGWRLGLVAAIAAAIVLAVFLKMPRAPAVLEDVVGSRKIAFGEVVRSGLLVLADSSRVEIRTNSELSLERADDGVRIHLRKGGVLVTAAKQRSGHLYVQTKELVVSVVGTVFLVNVEEEGSLVAVIEGEVRVKQGTIETMLRKNEQIATNPNMQMMKLTSLQQGQQPTTPRSTTPQTRTAPTPPNVVGDYTAEVAPPPGPSEAPQAPAPPPSPVRPGEVPKWDAVSIRPCAPPATGGGGRGRGEGGGGGGGGGPFRFSSDRMTLNCLSVRSLIRSAYHVYPELSPENSTPMDTVLISGIGVSRKNPTDGTDGGPEWIDTDRYAIEAKAEVVTDRALMQGPMLQALLEDRFKIKVHKETREISVDALVVARGGAKLKPFVEGSCVRRPPGLRRPRGPQTVKLHIKADANGRLSGTMETQGEMRPLSNVRIEGQSLLFRFAEGGDDLKGSIENNGARLNVVVPPRAGGSTQPPIVFVRDTAQTQSQPASQRYCSVEGGLLYGGRNPKQANIVYNAEGFTIDEFAKLFLNGYRGRFVVDNTGLTGKFNIHLEEEISAETRRRADPTDDLFAPSTAPPLPEALEKQLGLKLESTTGPVELLIIDYIERPSPN
jgi:hypothetical protein